MSRTLFWYIFKDLARIFLIALAVLAGIMSFGGLLRPLTEHGLAPAQVFTMLAYFLPAMSTYSLPVAALFATTMVYGRLSADNELTACRAAGISALAIATPAFVLGAGVTIFSFLFLFFIVPVCSLQVEKVIYSNVAMLVQSQIERNHRVEFDPPGGKPLTIFAQEAHVLPAPKDRPKDQVVLLVAPVFVTYEQVEREKKNAVPPPLDFYLARMATAFISQDEATGQLYVQATLQDGMKLPRSAVANKKEQNMQVAVESTTFYSDPMDSPLRENTRFMGLSNLLRLLKEPEKSKRLRGLVQDFIRDDQRNSYLEHLQDALADSEARAFFDAGAENYTLERGNADTIIRAGKLIITAKDNSEPAHLPQLRQVRNNATVLAVTAHQISIRVVPIIGSMQPGQQPNAAVQKRLAVEIVCEDASVSVGATVSPRSRFPRDFTVEMPPELAGLETKRVDDYLPSPAELKAGNYTPTSRVMILERNRTKLKNSIISEIHARASFSISCLILVLVGAGLGMMFRSGNFLSAFAISVVPAMMSILLIITGQHTCENIPWNITNFNNPLAFGVAMIWTGNVVVTVLATVLLGRLQRQ